MMRAATIEATCLSAACGPAQESDSFEQPSEQAEALELPCTAYLQGPNIARERRRCVRLAGMTAAA